MWIWEPGRGVVLPGIQQANGTLCIRGTERWAKHSVIFFPLETWREEDRKDTGCVDFFFFFSRKAHCREMKEGQRGPLYLIIGFKVIRNTQSHCNSKAMSPIAFVFI